MRRRVAAGALTFFLCATALNVAVEASCREAVIISEIAWAGTVADPLDEWIELRNIGDVPVDLNGWVLKWRQTHPTTPEGLLWKVVELSGILAPSPISLCAQDTQDSLPSIRLVKQDPSNLHWLVISDPGETDESYYTLQRRRDSTISNVGANLIYDSLEPYTMELSDYGEVILLLNERGEIMDTANANNSGEDAWYGGGANTFASMERVDPLTTDTPENWQTNLGIITYGLAANGKLLKATPGHANSPTLGEIYSFVEAKPAQYRPGDLLEVTIEMPTEIGLTPGSPSIYVTEPSSIEAFGQHISDTVFGRYVGTSYILEVDTILLHPGEYAIWIVFDHGETYLVPIVILTD